MGGRGIIGMICRGSGLDGIFICCFTTNRGGYEALKPPGIEIGEEADFIWWRLGCPDPSSTRGSIILLLL